MVDWTLQNQVKETAALAITRYFIANYLQWYNRQTVYNSTYYG
jgi:hypothetical protein